MMSDNTAEIHRYQISESMPPSRATYLAVAEAKECDPLDLPPLGQTVDTDSMDAFIGRDPAPPERNVAFEYAGCSLTVTPAEVRICPN